MLWQVSCFPDILQGRIRRLFCGSVMLFCELNATCSSSTTVVAAVLNGRRNEFCISVYEPATGMYGLPCCEGGSLSLAVLFAS